MSGARPASQPEGYLCFPRSGATAHAWQSNFSSIFKTPLCPSGLLKSKTPNSYASPLQGYCVSSWKQCLKPAAAFLGSREHFFESKRQHVSHKATCKQQALASSYSKGQVGRIIIIFFFCNSHSDGAEQSSHMQKQQQHSPCPGRNQRVSKHHCPSKDRGMTSRRHPGNYTAQLTTMSRDCKFRTPCKSWHQAICLHGNLAVLIENIPCTAACSTRWLWNNWL